MGKPRSSGWIVSLGLHLAALGIVLAVFGGMGENLTPQKIRIGFTSPGASKNGAGEKKQTPPQAGSADGQTDNPVSPGSGTGSPSGTGSAWEKEPPGLVRGTDHPRPLADPRAEYPRVARQHGWEGEVLVEAQVDREGRCTAVNIVKSSGHPVLDEAATQAMKATQFEPDPNQGKETEGRLTWQFTFRLTDGE